MPQKDDLEKQYYAKSRRLQKLKERQAAMGLETPVSVLTEIEDVEAEIENLQAELEDLGQHPTPTTNALNNKTKTGCGEYFNVVVGLATIVACIVVVCGFFGIKQISDVLSSSSNQTTDAPMVDATESPKLSDTVETVNTIPPIPTSTTKPTITPLPILTPTPELLASIELNHTVPDAGHEDVTITLTKVEILSTNRMRWHLSIWNQSVKDLKVWIWNSPKTYLADEFGNRYEPLADKRGTGVGRRLSISLQAGVKFDHWVEFKAPINGAKTFLVNFEDDRTSSDTVAFPQFQITLNYDTQLSSFSTATVQPPDITSLDINYVFPNAGHEDVTITLTKVEILSTNRMRWHLSIWNQSVKDLKVWIWNSPKTYLADEFGNRYEPLADKRGTGVGRRLSISLQAGVKFDHWVEFKAPINGAKTFLVNFEDDRTSSDTVAFSPQQITLPDY